MTSDRDFAEADSLWEFVTDPNQPATNDLERTVRRVQRTTDRPATSASVPRDAVWARVMASAQPAHPASPSRAATGFIASGGWARQQVGRWQSVVSFGLVLTFLASLLIVAHDRVISPALATATPTASDNTGKVPLDATPGADGECVAREVTWQEPETPPVRTPVPQYEAKQPAPREIGEAALETYIHFSECLQANPFENPDDRAALHSYLSGNMRPAEDSEALFGNWTPPSGASFTGGMSSGANPERVIDEAVIPLNQPAILHYIPFAGGTSHVVLEVFGPGHLYELIDGRYGVVIGSVSTDAFRNGADPDDNPPFDDGLLTWVSFVEQDGQLFIDEYAPFCVGEWVYIDGDGNQIATPGTDAIPAPDTRYVCR